MSSRIGICLIILSLAALAVCGKDEAPKPPLDSFVGTWEAVTFAFAGAGNWEYFHTLVLNADSSFTYSRIGKFEEQRIHYNSSGTYSVRGDRLILHHVEPTEMVADYTYEFTATTVILSSVSIPSDVKEYELQP